MNIVMDIIPMLWLPCIRKKAHIAAVRPLNKSNITIIIFRLYLSQINPAIGAKKTYGAMDKASILANITADPVKSRIYKDKLKRWMALPKRDIICPVNKIAKFLFFIKGPFYLASWKSTHTG
jgi:hypothetical protein